jgi:hypothetical protein
MITVDMNNAKDKATLESIVQNLIASQSRVWTIHFPRIIYFFIFSS